MLKKILFDDFFTNIETEYNAKDTHLSYITLVISSKLQPSAGACKKIVLFSHLSQFFERQRVCVCSNISCDIFEQPRATPN